MASSARVWDVLTDFEAYQTWNPFIVLARGKASAGSGLFLQLRIIRRKTTDGMPLFPTVLIADPGRELRWRGKFLIRGLFDTEQFFRLEARSGIVHFVHGAAYSGLLASRIMEHMTRRVMLSEPDLVEKVTTEEALRAAFEAMNAALKQRAEASMSPPVATL